MFNVLKQFLKKMLALALPAACIIAFTFNTAYAGHSGGLHIDAASWDGTTLTATGG